MGYYLETQSADDVYDTHLDIAGGDYELFSARVLGRDIKTICGPENYSLLVEILSRECDSAGPLNFIQQMQTRGQESAITRDIEMLNAVYNGVLDVKKRRVTISDFFSD
jgi:hypothetical protein